ncbi:MAG TPA: 2-C-methyl-D-erythritol 2,4-cyclodiphosphate synthase [Thermoanaerobaculia bacterium]|nr:2-C-methyl-D-erythritol 2,4-cyclodiphosphate synthase [Thermoanaerobaculia bacterium]
MIRIGQGIDVHPFETARPLVLGGLKIADRDGLAGHSDADAVLHAITDALLGAVAAGDIGVYFPSDDPKWKGAASATFVREALRVVAERGFALANVDVTIVAERPKLAPHREAICASIAALLEIGVDRVSVKATTTDHLGFPGRGEGIAVFAVVLVESR